MTLVVVRLKAERLTELSGVDLDPLLSALFSLKCESEIEDDYVIVEVNPDRPDMFISEGVARAVRGLYDLEHGWGRPQLLEPRTLTIKTDAPRSRPYVVGAIVRNVNVDEDLLVELMQFQEKLHDTIGRRRRKVAIGIHDLGKVRGPILRYTYVNVSHKMTPLGGSAELSVKEVLATTEQGQKYGSISVDGDQHPAILDSDGNVISLPPVINSELTRVEPGTQSLFIDVTGTDLDAVERTLDLIVTTITEGKRGAVIEGIKVVNDRLERLEPVLRTKDMTTSAEYVNSVLGTSLTPEEVSLALSRMRHGVREESDKIIVTIPPFRIDVISEIDLVEDVAMAIGYNSPRLEPTPYLVRGSGSYMRVSTLRRVSRDLMIGLGFTEFMSYTLTSSRLLSTIGLYDKAVRIKNPVSVDLDAVRPSLMPSVLNFLTSNKDRPKPLRVFEIGKVVTVSNGLPVDDLRLAAGIMDESVGFEDIQAVAYAYLRSLGLRPSTRPADVAGLLKLRSAELLANGELVGYLGEVDPAVLEALSLDYPVALMEVSLKELTEVMAPGASGP